MLHRIFLPRILLIDIETVPLNRDYNLLPSKLRKHWKRKASLLKNVDNKSLSELFNLKAGIYAEFGKIVCISVGKLQFENGIISLLRVKSIYNSNEGDLLRSFVELIANVDEKSILFCGHNIKEFDIPFICRRLLINNIEIPKSLKLYGKKPWETKHLIDTMELWRFGDYKHYTSLSLLTFLMGVKSPKEDIDGSMIRDVYFENNDLIRIVKYCERDVLATCQVLLRYMNLPLLEDGQMLSLTFS